MTRSGLQYLPDSTTCDIINLNEIGRKKLQKMRRNPNDWRIEQLEQLAKAYGIRIRKSGGQSCHFSSFKVDRNTIYSRPQTN